MVLGICLMVLAGIGLLAFLSRREQGELLQRMALYLYKLCCVYKLPLVEGQQVSMDLERLHPGSSGRELQMDYYVEKLKLFLVVLSAGCGLTMMLCLKLTMEENLGEEAALERSEAGGGSKDLYLQATVAGTQEEVYVNVLERQLEEEELKQLFAECGELLEQLILGENKSLSQVTKALQLPESVEGYPFEISWKSSDAAIIGLDGKLKQEGSTQEQTVCLTATLSYGEQSYVKELLVELASVQVEETLERKLQEAIWQEDAASKYDAVLPLPKELEGEQIVWRLKLEDNSSVFLFLTLVTAIGVFLLKDKDLHQQTLDRKQSLKMAYPLILNKFVLYMGAGLTVRGSFLKIAGDYQRNTAYKEKNIAYEEMLYSCHELSAGVSEGVVYERFGKRSGLQEYARFAALLGQNLKKGNSTLLGRLREESDKAMIEDLQFRKKIGEEAETKLLVPMVMMLGIVMLLVMIPAFTAFE